MLALSLSGVVTTLIMARFLVQVWRARPAAPDRVANDALVLPFVALLLGSVALPLLWPALAGSDAQPITEAAPGSVWPILTGALIALTAAIDAHTRRVGWAAFLAALGALIARAATRMNEALTRRRRAMARRGRAVPAAVDAWNGAGRLGQLSIAALLMIQILARRFSQTPDFETAVEAPLRASDHTPPPDPPSFNTQKEEP